MAFTDVFGGELIFPSRISYLALTTAVDVTLQWPTEQQITGNNVVADVMDVTTTAPSLNIDMPDSRNNAEGNKVTFNNVGAETFTVRDNTGGTIQSVAPGEQWILVLTDNSTQAGTWTTFQLGANVAVASASALAGAGIKAIGVLLNQQIDSDIEAATPFTVVEGDRAKCLVYTSGAGTANLPSPGAVGNDWFFMLRNSGSGTLNVVPPSGLLDGASSINLDPNDSAFFFTDGTDFFTIGLSAGSTIAFDFVSIPVPGSGDFVLSGANLDRIAYRFTGALTGNRRIVVPTTTQQYWVDNQTTNAFTLEISTAAGAGIFVPQGQSLIVYCDATDVINATSSTSVAFPITIGQGGTGATTVGGAQINLQVPPDSRILTAGDGIVGGGDLTADRTFDFNLASIGAVAPAVGDFIVLQDIDGGDINIKATLTDVLALSPGGVTVEDEGVPLATLGTTLDFVGAGVVASGAGATKTITIPGSGVGASAAASRMLRGDGSGGWVDAGALAILSAAGDLDIDTVNLVSGADQVSLFVSGGTCFITSSGGTIFQFQTDENWRFTSGSIFIAEGSSADTDVGGFAQLWSDGPHVTGTNPNTMMFTDDSGNDYRIDGVQRQATLLDVARTTDTVLSTVGNLSGYHIMPSRRFICRGVIWYTQASGGDIKLALTYDQTPEEAGHLVWSAYDAAGNFDSDVIAGFDSEIIVTTLTNGQLSCIRFECAFQSHDTLTGTLALQFAQNSSAGTTTMVEPSFFEVLENDNIS